MSPQSDADRDAYADALALVGCAHQQDFEGMQAILRHGNLVLTLVALARVCADLVSVLAEADDVPTADMLGWLRAGWTALG